MKMYVCRVYQKNKNRQEKPIPMIKGVKKCLRQKDTFGRKVTEIIPKNWRVLGYWLFTNKMK